MSNDNAATALRLSTCNTSATRSKGQRKNINLPLNFRVIKTYISSILDFGFWILD